MTDDTSGSQEDDVGPMADTTAPSFLAFNRTLNYPGPTSVVNVTTNISDEDTDLTVDLQYGYDNSTWSTKNASKLQNSVRTFTDRNPSSGFTTSRLTKTYSPGLEIFYLNVYIYNADHDTCDLTVRGYVESTSTWETIYYQYRSNDGTKVNTHFVNKGYSRWDINYYDFEANDNSFYNCTYKVRSLVYGGDIPAAGSNSKVYYRFNATDTSNNSALSKVMNYTIDTTPPQIHDFTKPAAFIRRSSSIPIYSNASDPTGVVSAYINWSTDGFSTHRHIDMSKISGNYTNAQYEGALPAPTTNTTVWIRIGAYDEGSNHNTTTSYNFTWNPPPTIEDVWTDPPPSQSPIDGEPLCQCLRRRRCGQCLAVLLSGRFIVEQ